MSTVAKAQGASNSTSSAARNDARTGTEIEDVQGRADPRHLAINKVGICDIRHPVSIEQRVGGHQSTVATFGMYVNLPHHFKGTHMSRFVQILNAHEHQITVESFRAMLGEMTERLEADNGHIEMSFPYFIDKYAPVTREKGVMDYNVAFIGDQRGDRTELYVEVKVPVRHVSLIHNYEVGNVEADHPGEAGPLFNEDADNVVAPEDMKNEQEEDQPQELEADNPFLKT